MISTDRNIFNKDSAVALRQIEYAKKYEEVHIIIFTNKNYTETSLGSNIFIYPTRSSSRWLYVFDALRLGRFIVEKRKIGDVTCQDPFETGLVGALIKNRHPVSLELQVHTDIGSPHFKNFNFLNRLRTLISKYTLPRADHIRVVSYRIQEYLSTIVEPSRIEVRPIAVDVEKIKNSPVTVDLHKKYPQFSKIILVVSRLEKEKNVRMALEGFRSAQKQESGLGLVIVGSGSEIDRLKAMSVPDVIFEGWQNDTASYLKTADLLLNTSWYEGYGVIFKEAEAAGLPIVSTDVGIAKEVGATIVKWDPLDISRGIMDACSRLRVS
jgi:glycosyltransferase involved in cell wall biosynthesis